MLFSTIKNLNIVLNFVVQVITQKFFLPFFWQQNSYSPVSFLTRSLKDSKYIEL